MPRVKDDKVSVASAMSTRRNTRRNRRKSDEDDPLDENLPVTPPKQKKKDIENLISPSTLLSKIKLDDSQNDENSFTEKSPSSKRLFNNESEVYQNARKALHSSAPTHLPGREAELKVLRDFITNHLENEQSGTLYVSGPPGTGKTASLSKIVTESEISSEIKEVYVNCTSMKSAGAIYSKVLQTLNPKSTARTEKDCLAAIEKYLRKDHKMILMVLDELDQLESKKQSILYTIFEWPAIENSKLILVGIANSLDLTDRILPRLQARCELKPQLLHFPPYSREQIVEIFTDRLRQAGILDVFSPVALQMLASKVAAVSGDVRRALDIGRRVIELVEKNERTEVLQSVENLNTQTVQNVDAKTQKVIEKKTNRVEVKQVMNVLNNVYGTVQKFNEEVDDTFPLQQKIVVCSLLLMLKKAKNKDVTVGKLHEVYRRVSLKQNIHGVDQAEFVGLCSLIEARGIIKVSGKKEPRLHKVHLEWDEDEIGAALGDKQLMSSILQDESCCK